MSTHNTSQKTQYCHTHTNKHVNTLTDQRNITYINNIPSIVNTKHITYIANISKYVAQQY